MRWVFLSAKSQGTGLFASLCMVGYQIGLLLDSANPEPPFYEVSKYYFRWRAVRDWCMKTIINPPKNQAMPNIVEKITSGCVTTCAALLANS